MLARDWIGCASACLALTACGNSSSPASTHPGHGAPPSYTANLGNGVTPLHFPRVTGGDYAVVFEPKTSTVSLTRDGTVLVSFPADGFELGRVNAVDDNTNYDPYPLAISESGYSPPAGLHWLPVVSAKVTAETSQSLTLALDHGENQTSTLKVVVDEPGSFTAVLTPDASDTGIAYFRLRPLVDTHEAFYGLGEYYDDVNSRGKVRAMQLEASGKFESGYNEAHVPVPFVIGTRGWGLFVECPYPGAFDVAAKQDDRVEATFGTGEASKSGITFHLFGADQPLDVTKLYYDVTGYPSMPARWALGPWIWRDENKNQAQVESDLTTIRNDDLAATAYWIDRPYATGVETFDFLPSQFPDPQAMIQSMHDLGFRTALWHSPYLDVNDPSTQTLRDVAKAKGYYPPVTGLLLNGWGPPIDLTNPAAFAWWQGLVETYTKMGVEGFKLDYGEDVVPGILGARDVWKFHDGSDERTMHDRFQLFYHSVYAQTLPASGGFLLCRHGTYGDQKNVGIIWPGDLDSSFAKQGETTQDASGNSYVAVGGLPASMIAGITLGPSGFPFFASDTGGYRHSPPDKELFTRWFEQTSVSTAMEIGTSTNDVAWEPTAGNGFDQQMLGWYRTYVRLHLRLWPYEWTYAQNLFKDGRAIERAFGLAYPELGVNPSDEYLFGDNLFVAPVLARGETERTAILPPGKWVSWWTGVAYDGGTAGGNTVTLPAALDTLPLLLRAGGIVPLLRPTIDTMSPTSQPSLVDSYSTTPGVLWAEIAPGDASSFTVFDGAVLTQAQKANGLELTYKDGKEFQYGAEFVVIAAGGAPSAVIDNGSALTEAASASDLDTATSGWAYDAANSGTLYVKVSPGTHTVEVAK
jgi:alpha-D-xyloside xylohydrolase